MQSNRLYYNSPAKYWTEALPLGNGAIGAMCFSGIKTDRIALNHDTLWSGHPRSIKKEGAYESYIKAQKMVFEGKYREAHEEIEKNFLTCWSQAYLPFGDIEFAFDNDEISEYERSLDLSTAIHKSSYISNAVKYEKTSFVSQPKDIFVYRIEADKENALSFRLTVKSPLKSNVYADGETLILDGECPGDGDTYNSAYPCNALIYSDNDKEKGIQFRGAVKIDSDGEISVGKDCVTVKNATYATTYLAIKTSYNGFDKYPAIDGREYKNACIETLNNAVAFGYEALMNEHIADYKSFYDRVEFSLGEDSQNTIPTDERLKEFAENKDDYNLYTLLFNYGRYLLISSSRPGTTATNLQGIWNDSICPPWNSNYTVNINTQMNYWPVLMCNMPELMTPLVDLIKSLSVTGRETAKDFYHADGFVVHHNADIWGHSVPVHGGPSWAFWSGGSGWLCRSLWEIYEYTLDKEFLEKTALPILREASRFYLDILVDDGNGNLIISPATSPENHFAVGNTSACTAKSTAMSNMITLDLLTNCKKAYEALGINDDFYARVCDAAEKILPLQIGKYGEILEWNSQLTETEVHHRHVSQLYALHPATMITEDKTKELFDACKKTLERRGDDGTGWSLAWKVNFWARLRDGNHALRLIDRQLNFVDSTDEPIERYDGGGGTFANMFDAHPPFQIDGNFGVVSGIGEMLLQSDGENIYLLPALPDKWKSGYVKGLLARGNVTVDICWENGKITDYKINGNQDKLNIILCR